LLYQHQLQYIGLVIYRMQHDRGKSQTKAFSSA